MNTAGKTTPKPWNGAIAALPILTIRRLASPPRGPSWRCAASGSIRPRRRAPNWLAAATLSKPSSPPASTRATPITVSGSTGSPPMSFCAKPPISSGTLVKQADKPFSKTAPTSCQHCRAGANRKVQAIPSRLCILVVDDDPLLIKSLRDTLETDGHVVTAVNSGQEPEIHTLRINNLGQAQFTTLFFFHRYSGRLATCLTPPSRSWPGCAACPRRSRARRRCDRRTTVAARWPGSD